MNKASWEPAGLVSAAASEGSNSCTEPAMKKTLLQKSSWLYLVLPANPLKVALS
jgi:hypothetical protein